jgi:hypothetical protein
MGWVVSITPRPRLPPGKGPPVPFGQEVGWAPEPVWIHRIEEKSFLPLPRMNPDRPVVQPVVRHYTARTNLAPVKAGGSYNYHSALTYSYIRTMLSEPIQILYVKCVTHIYLHTTLSETLLHPKLNKLLKLFKPYWPPRTKFCVTVCFSKGLPYRL